MLKRALLKSALFALTLVVPIVALTLLVGGPKNSVQSAAPALYVGSVNIPAAGSLTILGISPTAAPSVCLGLSPTFVVVDSACTVGVLSVTAASGGNLAISPNTGAVVAALASPAATAAPSSCAGFSATYALQYFTCVSTAGLVSSISGAGNLSGGGAGPTPPAIVLSSPSATACPSAMAGWNSTFGLVDQTGGCAAIVGQSKAAFTITVLPTATLLSTPTAGFYTRAFRVSPDMVSPTVDGISSYCDVAGSGGSKVTVQFYESFGTSPTFATSNPIATAVSWPTGSSLGGDSTFPATALPTSTTPGNGTWVYGVVQAVPTTPPSGSCSFELHGLQRIIQ
jgi:hypothetical protein